MNTVNVPELEIDNILFHSRGAKMGARHKLERRIIANLIDHLDKAGFKPKSVWDGEDLTNASTIKEMMELVFNLDLAWIHFGSTLDRQRTILLVLGNGEDIISDWVYQDGDPDGFNAAMDSFLDNRLPEIL